MQSNYLEIMAKNTALKDGDSRWMVSEIDIIDGGERGSTSLAVWDMVDWAYVCVRQIKWEIKDKSDRDPL